MSNNQESEFQTVKSKRGPGPRGQRIQNKNNQNQNKNSEQNDKPRLTFKKVFRLNVTKCSGLNFWKTLLNSDRVRLTVSM